MSTDSPHPRFDRSRLRFRPLAERRSKFRIDDIAVEPDAAAPGASKATLGTLDALVASIRAARDREAPVILCHGAHLIKNGLAPILIELVSKGWVTHVATNGAGSIHDWEFAYHGESTEVVRDNVEIGQFGIWEETGASLGAVLHVAGLEGAGYGESVGGLVARERVDVPSHAELEPLAADRGSAETLRRAAAALDLLAAIETGRLEPGTRDMPHPWKHRSVQGACFEHGAPFTVHPGIGQDIVYSHPLVTGAAVGRAAMADFLLFVESVSKLQGGVYISAGSSVMSPMIFEKAISMSRNIALARGERLDDYTIAVNDLAVIDWDWSAGEPPVDSPAYYVRFMKSFSRMGGRLEYIGMDNRAFLLHLAQRLQHS